VWFIKIGVCENIFLNISPFHIQRTSKDKKNHKKTNKQTNKKTNKQKKKTKQTNKQINKQTNKKRQRWWLVVRQGKHLDPQYAMIPFYDTNISKL
jgi:hypothetical protein